ncbi:hypothetical protein BDEG_28588 [Batrachochytrium dendrobatidis JEL423]|uniref:Uncharacterized protein n=1 Tax=Batrachochytrium dendrobatidis (strain JEL423) TaxID=403673 RepID=A0A177WZV3_BATDL|nr:hypothetical protein BDEG_28588 [Batrachochytrium dendrobatidis JEL423]
MKLAVAVLSSILFACSVTIANPIDPSATTSTESNTSPTHNPNGIGLGGLNPLPNIIKDLLEKHLKLNHNRNHYGRICNSLKSEYEDQKKLVMNLGRKIQVLKHKAQGNSGGPKYDDEIQETKVDLKAQKAKLADLGKDYHECESECNSISFELELVEIDLVELVFGGPWDPKSFGQQLSLIGKHPSVMEYFDGSGNKGQSSGRSKRLGQKPSGQQQHQDSQPSPDTPSESGSTGQGASSNRRKGSSKFMGKFGSFFGRPKK